MSFFTLADLVILLPAIALALAAFTTLIVDPLLKGREGRIALPFVGLGGVALSALAIGPAWSKPQLALGGSLAVGPFAAFFGLLVLGATALAILYSVEYARRLGFEVGEYFGLVLLSSMGMLLLVAANDLISLFVAFELMSLAVYCLAGLWRGDVRGSEGAMKYFVLGAMSSGFLLFGLALLYGATGTIYLDRMAQLSPAASRGIALAALALLVIGFAFKVGAVPFHAWVPDAYQGAPASVTGYMAVAVKAAAFAAFLRVLHATGIIAPTVRAPLPGEPVMQALWVLAVATMVLGNVAALTQQNAKRLLAYSGIAHSGYVLVGLTAATREPSAAAGALFYLAGYAATTIGAFAVLTLLRREGRDLEEVDDLAGLGYERPAAALAMTIFMVSLIGVPPTAVFMGKLWVFKSAIDAGFTGLVVIAVLTTALSIYYYLRLVVVMYMSAPAPASRRSESSWGGAFATAAAAAATLAIGILPAGIYDFALRSVRALTGQ